MAQDYRGQEAVELLPDSIRDRTPYSSRYSCKGGGLIDETGRIVAGLVEGYSLSDLREMAVNGALFRQRAHNTRKPIWDRIHRRFFTQQVEWIAADVITAFRHGPRSPEFVGLLYCHYVLRDHLTYDFVTQTLWTRWLAAKVNVSTQDVLVVLDEASATREHMKRWTEQTRGALASGILTGLRDLGLLVGRQHKTLTRPALPSLVSAHLLRVLVSEGLTGADIVRDPAWRMFILTHDDVAGHLGRLAQEGSIRFERTGRTVVLETPPEWRADH